LTSEEVLGLQQLNKIRCIGKRLGSLKNKKACEMIGIALCVIAQKIVIITYDYLSVCRSRWSGHFLVEAEPKLLGLAPAPGM
jgi:hypothetical protein